MLRPVLHLAIVAAPLCLGGCGGYAYGTYPTKRIAPTRVDPAFTGASTRVDPRFFNGGPYVGTGVVGRGPLYGAATGLRRY